MHRLDYLGMSDYGLSSRDIEIMDIYMVNRDRSANRLKHLEVYGRWHLGGSSIPFISTAFNHCEKYEGSNDAMRAMKKEPLNAIQMMMGSNHPQPEAKVHIRSAPPPPPPVQKPKAVWKPPPMPIIETEEGEEDDGDVLPHRSFGYGVPSLKRQLTPHASPRPSRSTSPAPPEIRHAVPVPAPPYGKENAPHQRQWQLLKNVSDGLKVDTGDDHERPPHRTAGLSPLDFKSPSMSPMPRDEIREIAAHRNPKYFTSPSKGEERRAFRPVQNKKGQEATDLPPYRSHGYGVPSVQRKISPKANSPGHDELLESAQKLAERSMGGPPKRRTIASLVRESAL